MARTVLYDDETGALLEEPYACAFLTAPAPNAGVAPHLSDLPAAFSHRTAIPISGATMPVHPTLRRVDGTGTASTLKRELCHC